MCLTAYFLEIRQRDGENTPLLYISTWKREGNAGGKKRKKRVPGRKSVDAGRKKRGDKEENILTGLKCRQSGKQEKTIRPG